MSARRACGSHAPSFIGCLVCGSSSPTASQFMPGRHSACRGKLGLPLSRKISPLIFRYAPVGPSCRHSPCLPSVRYSGSRYFSHSAGGSITWLSPSNTANSLAIICSSHYAPPFGYETLVEKSDARNHPHPGRDHGYADSFGLIVVVLLVGVLAVAILDKGAAAGATA